MRPDSNIEKEQWRDIPKGVVGENVTSVKTKLE